MIVVAGEALVDVVTESDGTVTETPGGSPLNVAVGLARLDVPATLYAQVGDDDRAAVLVEHVTSSGAQMIASPTSTGRTSTAVATLDATGAAHYEFDLEWSLPRQTLPSCDGVHVGSLGTVLEPGRESVLDLVDQAVERGLLVSFDVNVRASFVPDAALGWRQASDLAARCPLVKLSDEDALTLRPDQSVEDTASDLLAGEHTQLVLLTRGPDGATAFSTTGEVSVTPRPTAVVDTVGAGDAFMSGTLARLHDLGTYAAPAGLGELAREDLRLLIAGAVEVAALTCERRGANPPTRAELPSGWPGSTSRG